MLLLPTLRQLTIIAPFEDMLSSTKLPSAATLKICEELNKVSDLIDQAHNAFCKEKNIIAAAHLIPTLHHLYTMTEMVETIKLTAGGEGQITKTRADGIAKFVNKFWQDLDTRQEAEVDLTGPFAMVSISEEIFLKYL